MSQVVIVGGAVPEPCISQLLAEHAVVELDRNEIASEYGRSALESAEGIIVIGQVPLGREFFELTPALRVLSLRAVGYDSVDLEECALRRIVVCNTAGTLDRAVADLTVMLILAVTRRLPQALAYDWVDNADRPALGADINAKRIGLYGYGRIGSLTAKTLSDGFGAEVVYHNRSGGRGHADRYARWVERDELFQTSDVVSIHTPLIPETRHSVGARELGLMQRTAYLVNTSRGAVIDEQSLIDALVKGTIAGAALDVLEAEPPRPDNPLLMLDNVIITPHIGSATEQTRLAMASRATENLLAVLGGRPPISVVLDEQQFATTAEGTR
ncbi:2-hydroxyacid dehydrogenase [Rhodococcus qingshengii]|uniref:2-hydroxyacid dehydrogenase n=1 Tax=Rhodococcus qingshengii TaxID=334542 RepID=UPI001ADF0C7F|nr:NAD(P)-dependent oxidoreductase [Rhodococcus qingshengii]